ncbi:hypothetical protein SBC2_77000 (plasmid) [Caballeronia sp. SBC2]|nr:hypothetical protein SBC2_77000 [Caballeronia sp. SBC2]
MLAFSADRDLGSCFVITLPPPTAVNGVTVQLQPNQGIRICRLGQIAIKPRVCGTRPN